eukprot:CAMPEP_0177708198 /NCGR_PEP_ID=MMETSP0484_2-20121128/10153_1 /TAXON_ID=354590 /ORGANISM="Rhodomonas lens, Strain RHODO" /LENGTH=362 /DNA_ID=CAMNT_0019219755 /DNA_START=145 /DNA_END=1233 /DNA_ORIENTATION=+
MSDSGEDYDDGNEEEVMEPLTFSMQKAAVVHRRESEMNGDILVEELVRSPSDKSGVIVRRMRFLSNLELEQTEVRLIKVLRSDAPKKKLPGSARDRAATRTRPPKPVLKADSTYLPYECLQGMLISIPLLPDWERKEVPDHDDRAFSVREKLEVLIIGLAGGMLPRFLRFNFPNTSVDCVELDPVVVDVAREYFGFEPDEKLHVHVADGVEFIEKAPEDSYDIVIIDANAVEEDKTLEAPPPGFITHACLANCAKVLRPGGIMTMNVLCSSPTYFQSILDKIKDAFFGRICFLKDQAEDADENYVVFALNHDAQTWPPSREELSRRLTVLEKQTPPLVALELQARVANHFWDGSGRSEGVEG